LRNGRHGQEFCMEEEVKALGLMCRREYWRMRWGAEIKKHRAEYCSQCQRQSYCNRLHANEYIRRMMFSGADCPDMFSIWETVLDGTRHL